MSRLGSRRKSLRFQFIRKVIYFVCAITISDFCQSQDRSVPSDQAAEENTSSHRAFAAIEFAEYRAKYSAGDLVDGSFRWDLLHRGSNATEIDLSESNIAMKDLQSSLSKVIWGTTQEGRRIVIVDSETKSIDGIWSLHGRRYPGRTVFDCKLPPSLNSRLRIQTPSNIQIQSSVGFVQSEIDPKDEKNRNWIIDLGRHRNASISFTKEYPSQETAKPKVDVETVYVARQDGFFVQTDFTIEALPIAASSHLEIQISDSMNIQAVTSSGVPLNYQIGSQGGKTLRITLPEAVPRTRVNLRVQGFKPARWVRPHRLPSHTLTGAIETKRIVSLRIESPLELHGVQREGFFQSNLTEELRGEIWKFEAFQENPKLIVDLGQRRTSLKAEIHTLHFMDTPLPWVLSQVTTSVKNGQLFQVSLNLPKPWTIVSVQPVDPESEISSWSVEKGYLVILFKKPMSVESKKTIEILARTSHPELDIETTFPSLRVDDSSTTSVQSDWVLPRGRDIDLPAGGRWNSLTSKIKLEQFISPLPLEHSSTEQVHRSYFNSNVNVESKPTFRYLTIATLGNQILEADESNANLTESSQPDHVKLSAADFGQLDLLTQADSLGDVDFPRLVHHANLNFLGRVAAKELDLKLSEKCLLSSVTIDEQPVTVYRDGEQIVFPKDVNAFKNLTLIYITETNRNFLTQDCTVPLPRAQFPFSQFHWTLEIPDERKLNHVQIPGADLPDSIQQFFFGPLSSNRYASSLSNNAKSSFSSHFVTLKSTSNHQNEKQFQFHSLSNVSEVRFQAWNVVQASNLGWVTFFACMIIGVGGRLSRSKLIRHCSPYWLVVLLVTQIWMTNELSMIVGAMLAGTLISILLPVEFLKLPEMNSYPTATRKLATPALIAGLLLGHSAFAQEPEIVKESIANPNQVRFLLRTVVYQASISNSNQYRATLEVLTPQSAQETLVELPYQGIVFQSGAECLVDGEKQALIPALSGKGVVIRVPNRTQLLESGIDSDWQAHSIQFEFSLRESSESLPESVKFPTIQDSALILNQNSLFAFEVEPQSYDRQGQLNQFSTGEINIALGPVDSLFTKRTLSEEIMPPTTIYTLLNLSAARVSGKLFIPQQVIGSENYLILNVPVNTFITNVAGDDIAQWFLTQDEQSQRKLVVEYKPGSSNSETSVTFHLPSSMNTQNEIVVPELNWGMSNAKQLLGIKATNGVEIEIAPNQNNAETFETESWPQNELLGRTRPDIVLNMLGEPSIRFVVKDKTPTTKNSISETLTVERSRITWKATVEIEVTEIPLFVHNFELIGGVRVNSVRSQDAGNLVELRHYQDGKNLVVFIPGGQLGLNKFNLTGDVPFSPESKRSLPGIVVEDSEQTASTVSIFDQTNWEIELTQSDGNVLKIETREDANVASNRLIGEFSTTTSNERPTHIRLLPPPSATRVDVATRIHINDGRTWNCVQLLHFQGNETPIKTVTFTVPNSLGNVRIGPRNFRLKMKDLGESTEYSIPIPDRFSDEVTLQVYSKLPSDFVESLLSNKSSTTNLQIPGVQVSSARTVSQFLFFNENRLVMVPELESIPVERKNLPQWIPLQWQEAVNSLQLQAFQMTEGTTSLVRRENPETNDQPLLHFAETVLWQQKKQKVIGMTRLWLTGAQRFTYQLPFRDEIHLKRVLMTSKGDLHAIDDNNGKVIQIENFEPAIPLVVYWETQDENILGIESPLDSSLIYSAKELIGLVNGNTKNDKAQTQQSLFNSLIYRWQALINITESTQIPVPVESQLYGELIESNSQMNELLQQKDLTKEQRKSIENTQELWSKVSESLTISAGPVFAENEVSKSTFDLLVGAQNQFQSIEWFIPDSENKFHIQLTPETTIPAWMTTGLKAIFVFVALLLLYRFRMNVKRVAIFVQRKPVIRLLILGGMWLLFFQPISLGLLIITIAFVLQVSKVPSSAKILKTAEI